MFVAPLLLPEYPAAQLALGRYLVYGLVALPLAWADRAALARLERADWLAALGLVAVGNLLYYLCLAGAIQRAGGPLPTMINGALPLVIALAANLREAGRLPWRRLWPSLLLIGGGIACVNHAELAALDAAPAENHGRYAAGALLALIAVACWTWYPLRNADWLRRHPHTAPRAWSTAQGLAMLPLALTGYAVLWLGMGSTAAPMPLGPRPLAFVLACAVLGLGATWLASVCWNQASRRLPTALAGQLMVFETLAGLAYLFLLRGQWPPLLTLLGAGQLVAGVVWAVRMAAPSCASPLPTSVGRGPG
jgi:drug/metabolite transporter (DMT)-like permease